LTGTISDINVYLFFAGTVWYGMADGIYNYGLYSFNDVYTSLVPKKLNYPSLKSHDYNSRRPLNPYNNYNLYKYKILIVFKNLHSINSMDRIENAYHVLKDKNHNSSH